MKTLADIRKENERKDLLFIGMEQKPVELPSDIYSKEIRLYECHIKPHVEKFLFKQTIKGNI